MSKIVLDVIITSELNNNSVIRYNKSKKSWESVSYETFNHDLYKERNDLKKQIKGLEDYIADILKQINAKLETHDKSLKILLKE